MPLELEKMRVGIDLMGGDQPPQAIFEAVLQVRREIDPSYILVVILHHSLLADLKKQYISFFETYDDPLTFEIEFICAEETIEMQDSPLLAVRRKKKSSMTYGMRMLKEQRLDAFISTGNTGALIASAMLYLPLLPNIQRPALLVVLPAGKRGVVVLDVGANVSIEPKHFLDFAKLGILYRECAHHLTSPTVGLLNIGVEEAKGTKLVKEAYTTLQTYFENSPGQFLGNVEGREVFQGHVDILITDGFTGNVFLKTCEGVSAFVLDYLKEKLSSLGDQGMSSLMGQLLSQFNYSQHPGALLCGVDGLVIKCHGNSNIPSLISGIKGACALAKTDLISKMKKKLESASHS